MKTMDFHGFAEALVRFLGAQLDDFWAAGTHHQCPAQLGLCAWDDLGTTRPRRWEVKGSLSSSVTCGITSHDAWRR